MNKSQLNEELAERLDRNPHSTKACTDLFFAKIKEALAKGDNLEIRGFGTFHLKEYKGYQGRNPKTGSPVVVPPKRLPVFRAGKELRERVNQD